MNKPVHDEKLTNSTMMWGIACTSFQGQRKSSRTSETSTGSSTKSARLAKTSDGRRWNYWAKSSSGIAAGATSLLDKQMAVAIAKRTRGVEAVLNQLIVVPSDRSDDDIRGDVDKVLRINDSVDEPRIVVDVSRGEASLIGKVDSLAEKRIGELASR